MVFITNDSWSLTPMAPVVIAVVLLWSVMIVIIFVFLPVIIWRDKGKPPSEKREA